MTPSAEFGEGEREKGEGCSATRAAQLSIIIPCLNEGDGIVAALAPLQKMRGRGVEVVVVDGGSSDSSPRLASPLADRVLTAPRGRASQMNAGGSHARGHVLLFLHADCILPEDADCAIAGAMAASGKRWGRFDVTLGAGRTLLRCVAWMMNLRSRLTHIATGDQGIFVERQLFRAVGGFPNIPLMEDIAFSKILKSRGAPICLPQRLAASARRWESEGVLRTIVLMWRLRLWFWCGADPRDLALRYGRSSH